MVDPEWWILETASENLYPLGWIIGPGYEERLNKTGHGLSSSELAEVMERMLWRGDLFISDARRKERLYTTGELESLLRPGIRSHHFGLTSQGGRRWEQRAGVTWTRFVSESWCFPEEDGREGRGVENCEIVCADPDRLRLYVEHRFSTFGSRLVPGTVVADRLCPWDATYWKLLPEGHRVRCAVFQPGQCELWNENFEREFRRWYHRCDEGV